MAFDLTALLGFAKEQGASDVHMSSGMAPMLRIRGQVTHLEVPALTADEMRAVLYGVLNDEQRKAYDERHDIDFAFEIPGVSRFRANFFIHLRGPGAVFRLIPSKIVSLDDLQMPPVLKDLASRQGGFLSGGEQQMLTIGRTLMGNPELLLLDEPSEGLAPLVVESMLEQIGRLKREGLTILLAEQGVDFSLALADRVYVLEKGAVRFAGRAAELRDNPRLRDELLALSTAG